MLKNCSSYRLGDTPGYPVVTKHSSIPGRLDGRQQCSLEEASLPNLGTHRIEGLPFDSTQHRLEVHPNYRHSDLPSPQLSPHGPRAPGCILTKGKCLATTTGDVSPSEIRRM